ncbi:MAG: hypothetical protein M1114_05350 [Candidatus Dependentiae bacterium]|nr:hypothetical protein [Candidatus Dependentiae bacterium]
MKKITIFILLSFSTLIYGAGQFDLAKKGEKFALNNTEYIVSDIEETSGNDNQPGTFTITLQRNVPILLKRTATSGPGIGLKEALISPLTFTNQDPHIQVEVIEKPLTSKDQYINTNDVKTENGITTGTIRIQGINYNVVNATQDGNKTTYALEYPAEVIAQKKITGKIYLSPFRVSSRVPDALDVDELIINNNEKTIKVTAPINQPQIAQTQKIAFLNYFSGINNVWQRVKGYFSNLKNNLYWYTKQQ